MCGVALWCCQVASAEGRSLLNLLVRWRHLCPAVDLFTRFLEGRYNEKQLLFYLYLRTGVFACPWRVGWLLVLQLLCLLP